MCFEYNFNTLRFSLQHHHQNAGGLRCFYYEEKSSQYVKDRYLVAEARLEQATSRL